MLTRQVLLGKPHFRTLHGRFGLAALLLGIAAPLGGVLSFKSLGLLKGASEPVQTRVKWVHRKVRAAQLLPLRQVRAGSAACSTSHCLAADPGSPHTAGAGDLALCTCGGGASADAPGGL